jgi:hypothetical protein
MNKATEAQREMLRVGKAGLDSLRQQSHKAFSELRKSRTRQLILSAELVLLLLIGIYFISPAFTGFVTQEQTFAYKDTVTQSLNSSSEYQWIPLHNGELISLRISGKIIGSGTARIYLDNLLVYETHS